MTTKVEPIVARSPEWVRTISGPVALGLACAFAALPALLIDVPLAKSLSALVLPGDLRKLLTYAEVFGHGLGVLLIIATASVLDRRGGQVLVTLGLQSFLAGGSADIIKLSVGRTRPYVDLGAVDGWHTFQGWFPQLSVSDYSGWLDPRYASFPSAHAATAAGLAVGLCNLYPRGKWLFLTFAVLAGAQRCLAQAHFLSDVLFGFAVGIAASLVVRRSLHAWGYGERSPFSA